MTDFIETELHPILDTDFVDGCRQELREHGVLVLGNFFTTEAIEAVLAQSDAAADEAYFTTDTHNVYLTPQDPALSPGHVFNRQISSTKGCLTHDQIPLDSPLREVYESPEFRSFLCNVLDIEVVHPYADTLSSINVHFHGHTQDLGWHFDNSAFAVTMLIRAPTAGGVFEFAPSLRYLDNRELNFDGVAAVLDGQADVNTLSFNPGALVLFRGHEALHRVTPSLGEIARVLVVFAYNTEPGVGLSDAAKLTFYGRLD